MVSRKFITVSGMALGSEMLHVNQHIIIWKIEVSNIIHWITQVHSGFSSVITVTFAWAICGSNSLSEICWSTGNSDPSTTVTNRVEIQIRVELLLCRYGI